MSKAKILIVDDEPDMVIILKRILEVSGYEAIVATTGQEALEKTHKNHPDLILLDVTLPDTTGHELCSRLKQEKDIPIFFLSARAQKVDIDRGLGAGANGYITKPFDPFQLVERVKNTLGGKHRA